MQLTNGSQARAKHSHAPCEPFARVCKLVLLHYKHIILCACTDVLYVHCTYAAYHCLYYTCKYSQVSLTGQTTAEQMETDQPQLTESAC